MTISKHAEKRMRERLGLNKKSIQRIAERALNEGISHSDSTGKLHKYLDSRALIAPHYKCNWRVYGEYLYCFSLSGDTLITVINLDNDIKKYLAKMKG